MGIQRGRRRLEPLTDVLQGALRKLIREAPSAEQTARALRLPLQTVLAGASGARLLPSTRYRNEIALERRSAELAHASGRRAEAPHLRIVPAPGPEPLRLVIGRVLASMSGSANKDDQ